MGSDYNQKEKKAVTPISAEAVSEASHQAAAILGIGNGTIKQAKFVTDKIVGTT
jgi:hypothetical protein